VIACLRTVRVPETERARYLEWIAEGRAVREAHGILAELVLEPVSTDGATVVLTLWPSHDVFDAWIVTPERDALTASDVHQAVDYRPITRYEIAGGYLNLAGLARPRSETTGPKPQGDTPMKWVTRARPKTDRIACPWLIRRFIDPDAEILYVPAGEVLDVAARDDALSFDAPGAEYDHRNGKCTFEVLLNDFDLDDDPALMRLARIVHAADIDGELDTDTVGAGLLAIGLGGLDVEADDHRLLDKATFVYDALYAWCRRQVEGQPA
jgi:heme-degrading monooxygenase HmoA